MHIVIAKKKFAEKYNFFMKNYIFAQNKLKFGYFNLAVVLHHR